MVYVLGWTLNYLVLALWYLGARNRVVFFPVLFVIGGIIFVRYSGTDTFMYELTLRSVLEGDASALIEGWEPGFVFLAKLLLSLTGSEVLALRAIGLVFTLLLLAFVLRADKTELRLFALYILPVFAYQYGMNAVRAGLALATVLLAWQAMRRGKILEALLITMLAITFHYSMVLVAALIVISELKLGTRRSIVIIFVLALTAIFLVVLRYEYFEAKISLYRSYASPSLVSGLSRLGLVVLLWLYFALSGVSAKRSFFGFLLTVVPSVSFQALAFSSYAGLRLLELMTFVSPLLLLRDFDRHGEEPRSIFWLGVFVAGLVGVLATYRNFLTDYDGRMTGTLTPFLPYRTIFDYRP
ncbi:hypothetical protein YIM730264_25510 [Thermus hydrothermalis]